MINFHINNTIKALIFDCDGTLVDSMPLHMKAWEEVFKIFNENFDYDYLYSLKGMREIEIIGLYNKKFGININAVEMVSIKQEYFLKNINSIKPIEAVVNIAKEYYGKLPQAVVSGSVKEIVLKELKIIGISHLFKIFLTASDSFPPKPAPDIFIAAAKSLNVLPEQCLVFEDADSGLEAAEKAGMKKIDVREFI